MSYLASWSGGKDGAFACWEALRQGCAVTHLVNFVDERSARVRFHGTEARLIHLQAEAAGLTLVQRPTAADDYEPAFKRTVRELLPLGVEGMVFGDLYVDEHREWVERVCGELGIKALEPLWGKDPERHARDVLDAGFTAVVVAADARFVDAEWVGRPLDHAFLDYLRARGADPCGERGEYHTFVTAGPLFAGRLVLTRRGVVQRDGYWFLDVRKCSLESASATGAAGGGVKP